MTRCWIIRKSQIFQECAKTASLVRCLCCCRDSEVASTREPTRCAFPWVSKREIDCCSVYFPRLPACVFCSCRAFTAFVLKVISQLDFLARFVLATFHRNVNISMYTHTTTIYVRLVRLFVKSLFRRFANTRCTLLNMLFSHVSTGILILCMLSQSGIFYV